MKLVFVLIMLVGGIVYAFIWHLLFVPTLMGIRDRNKNYFSEVMGSCDWRAFEVPIGVTGGFGKMLNLMPVFFRFTKLVLFNKDAVGSFFRKTFLISLSLAVLMLVGGFAGFVYVIPKIQ
jgi:hypothetical protein